MGRLTEAWAIDKPGNKRDYAYTTPESLLDEKMGSKQKAPHFTEQQIDDYCEKVGNLCLICRNEGALMFQSVRIIRQLQEGLRQAFIERRVYVDMSWERPEEHIIAIDQLQCVAQVLLEKEAARDQQEHLQGAWMTEQNEQAIALLDEWFAEPDDMGDEFWLEHEQQLAEGLRLLIAH